MMGFREYLLRYTGTRAFYERAGYRLETVLPIFDRPGDGRAIVKQKI